jgi:hypothetical protein
MQKEKSVLIAMAFHSYGTAFSFLLRSLGITKTFGVKNVRQRNYKTRQLFGELFGIPGQE